jgi:hypothetical protein
MGEAQWPTAMPDANRNTATSEGAARLSIYETYDPSGCCSIGVKPHPKLGCSVYSSKSWQRLGAGAVHQIMGGREGALPAAMPCWDHRNSTGTWLPDQRNFNIVASTMQGA